MCWVNKCCYFVPLDYACIIVGRGSLLLSTVMTFVSVVFLTMKESNKHWHKEYLKDTLKLDIKEISINILLWIILIINLMWIIISVMLLIGLKKNKPSLVLCYFSFGIFTTIVVLLSSILELVQNYWVAAFIEIIASTPGCHSKMTPNMSGYLMPSAIHRVPFMDPLVFSTNLLQVSFGFGLFIGGVIVIFIHFLIVVHAVYEQMLKGQTFGGNAHHRLDEEPFIENVTITR